MRRRRPAGAVVVVFCALLAAHDASAGDIYRIDPVHSTILFRIKHLGVSWAFGRFRDFSGTLELDEAHPERSTIRVEVDPASIDTGHDKRDKHLRSADFLDVERFPSATFVSTSVRKEGDQTYAVVGDLTLHGVQRPVTLEMQFTGSGPDPWGGSRAGFEGSTTIRRSEFGVDHYDAGAPGALGDQVQITLSVEAVRR